MNEKITIELVFRERQGEPIEHGYWLASYTLNDEAIFRDHEAYENKGDALLHILRRIDRECLGA